MGILMEAEYGLYHLEDPTGRILVSLSQAVLFYQEHLYRYSCLSQEHQKAKRPRLFTEGGLVVVEGKMQEDRLIVDLIDVPDAASKEEKPFIPSPQVCDSMSYDETITVSLPCLTGTATRLIACCAEGDGKWWRPRDGCCFLRHQNRQFAFYGKASLSPQLFCGSCRGTSSPSEKVLALHFNMEPPCRYTNPRRRSCSYS